MKFIIEVMAASVLLATLTVGLISLTQQIFGLEIAMLISFTISQCVAFAMAYGIGKGNM